MTRISQTSATLDVRTVGARRVDDKDASAEVAVDGTTRHGEGAEVNMSRVTVDASQR